MSLFHLEMDDSSLVGPFPRNLGVVPRRTLAYIFSFKLPEHEMYTMDDLFPGEMLVLVYDHNLLKICLTILPFPDVGLFLEVARCTQIPTENNDQTVGRRGTKNSKSSWPWVVPWRPWVNTPLKIPPLAALVQGVSLRWFILSCECCISISKSVHKHATSRIREKESPN